MSAAAIASALELHSLGMQFHDLSNSLGVLSQQLLDSDDAAYRPVQRWEHDELAHAAASLRLLTRGAASLLDDQGMPF